MNAPPAPGQLGHLILVGLPGAGKTTVGRDLARALRRPFIDFDEEFERRQGTSVSAFFAKRGQLAFRIWEVELTRELATQEPMVWAPGGGWITNSGVLELVRPPGRIIHLRVSPEVALARMGYARASRPLLMEANPRAVLDRLWGERKALYELADAEVDTEAVDLQQVAKKIALLAQDFDTSL